MIDMTKQYTYKGRPVRIYADGSDTYNHLLHIAYFDEDEWVSHSCSEYDLIEVWQPKEGEIVWDIYNYALGRVTYTDNTTTSYIDILERLAFPSSEISTCSTQHCAPFTGTLPEAFKGL